ncbi:MAG: D-beta-hydroxybutyrate dehydrogenase [Bdellovibrionaceae bacterium]|nr:D-beta-hydroxybutyrate dehydrogenase [Pseudobdellovibrionaceae bacterium]
MNPVAVVTGASSGIGLAIAEQLSSEGYKVFNFDLRPGDEESKIEFIQCDVSDDSSVISAMRWIHDKAGRLDVLVNNCGLQYMAPVEDFPKEKWDLLIGVMLTGTFLCSREAFKYMKPNKFGRIVNISSVHGKLASPYKAAYVAAKHGVHGLAKVIAIEGAEHGITVNTVCPGFVDTPLMRQQVQSQMELNDLGEEEVLEKVFLKDQCLKKLTQPDQVAGMVKFLVSKEASTITGEAFNVSGGWGMGL